MRDVEFILRFFALSSDFILKSHNPPVRISLKKYLNQFMDEFNSDVYIDLFRTRFTNAVSFAHQHLGLSAFHNISPSNPNSYVERFSPTLFDSLLIAIDFAIVNNKINPGIKNYIDRKKKLLEDKEFQSLLSQETMKIEKIRERINIAYRYMFSE